MNAIKGHRQPNICQEWQGSDIQPVSQIAPGSYLGQAMSHVKDNKELPSDPSDSSSSSSNAPSSESSSLGSEDGHSERTHKHSRPRSHRSKTKSRSMKSKKSLLKPLPPLEYDGAADAHSYHWFVTEGTDYVISGHIHK